MIDGLQRPHDGQPRDAHLQDQARAARPGDLVVKAQHRLEVAGEGLDIDPGADLAQAGLLLFSHVEVAAGAGAEHDQRGVSQELQDLGGELAELVAVVVDLGDDIEAALGLTAQEPL